VLDTLDSQHAVQLRAATLLRLSEHLQAPERGGRLMITVDGLTPLPTTELDDYLVVCKEFPDAGAALGRHLAWELGSDDATAVLSRAEAWIGGRLRNQPAPGRMRDLAAALAVMVREGGGLPVAERDYQRHCCLWRSAPSTSPTGVRNVADDLKIGRGQS
jgi:hypothetical protein